MKKLKIEWRHLDVDGTICERCSNTGETVRSAYETLRKGLQPEVWHVTFEETLLNKNEIPESNMILINGIPMEELLPEAEKSENCCDSCCEILGSPTLCRTIERYGETYETIPATLILEAVHNFIQTKSK